MGCVREASANLPSICDSGSQLRHQHAPGDEAVSTLHLGRQSCAAELPMLLMSGYTPSDLLARGLEATHGELVTKQPRVRLHDLRHCHGQWTLEAAISDVDVQRYMGHATT
jgi:hypothetical protein